MDDEKTYQEIRKDLIDKYKTIFIPKLTNYAQDLSKIYKQKKTDA